MDSSTSRILWAAASRAIPVFILLGAVTACTPSKDWTDEVLLHDGRTIKVERTVHLHFGRGELAEAVRRWPDQHTLRAKNPDTGEVVAWYGERVFDPVLFDFSDGIPYVVIKSTRTYSNLAAYGCPEIPYVFFRYSRSERKWHQIPGKELPTSLRLENLSDLYDGATSAKISSGDYTKQPIPRDFASWTSPYKNQYRVGHSEDGCRHVVPSNKDPPHPQSPGQPVQRAQLEILDVTEFEPEKILSRDEWRAMSWDVERAKRCNSFLTRVGDESDRPELRGWLLFVNDPTGHKKARDQGLILCDEEALWFGDYASDPQQVILTKFTIAGDFKYRIMFARPEAAGGYEGHILQRAFHVEDGYLYFEWWNTNQSGWNHLVRKSMRVRVQEPSPVSTTTRPQSRPG